MSFLWTSEALLDAVNGRPIGEMPEGVNGVSIDTRSLKPGEAFFAIKGDRFDGHNFLPAAMKAGAALPLWMKQRLPRLGA